MKGAIVLAAMITAIGTTQADARHDTAIASGNELLQDCREDGWNNGYCSGFILGVFRGVQTYGMVSKTTVFCPTSEVTVEQTVLIVQQYLISHPKILDKAADLAVSMALFDAFPCK